MKNYNILIKKKCVNAFIRLKGFIGFQKNKKRSGTSLPALFSAKILKKNISLDIFNQLTKFHCLVVFTSWDIGQCVYCNCLLNRLWRLSFKINLISLIKPFFQHDKKIMTKNLNILRMKKRVYTRNKKHY